MCEAREALAREPYGPKRAAKVRVTPGKKPKLLESLGDPLVARRHSICILICILVFAKRGCSGLLRVVSQCAHGPFKTDVTKHPGTDRRPPGVIFKTGAFNHSATPPDDQGSPYRENIRKGKFGLAGSRGKIRRSRQAGRGPRLYHIPLKILHACRRSERAQFIALGCSRPDRTSYGHRACYQKHSSVFRLLRCESRNRPKIPYRRTTELGNRRSWKCPTGSRSLD